MDEEDFFSDGAENDDIPISPAAEAVASGGTEVSGS
jgi:hypothetical protein